MKEDESRKVQEGRRRKEDERRKMNEGRKEGRTMKERKKKGRHVRKGGCDIYIYMCPHKYMYIWV